MMVNVGKFLFLKNVDIVLVNNVNDKLYDIILTIVGRMVNIETQRTSAS